MPVLPKTACTKCDIVFALAEAKEVHKGKEYHPECWAQHREDALRLLLRLHAHNIVPLLTRKGGDRF